MAIPTKSTDPHTEKQRIQGMRLVQRWLPDMRRQDLRAEAARQSRLIVDFDRIDGVDEWIAENAADAWLD